MSKTMKGTLMTLIAGIAWGLSGACGQYLMAHGFTAIGLTTIRLVFSGSCTTASCLSSGPGKSKGLSNRPLVLPSLALICFFRVVNDPIDLSRSD